MILNLKPFLRKTEGEDTMAKELTYVLITPYTIMKSRTGGILARLLARSEGLDLVAAQMLAPTKEFAEDYARMLEETVHEKNPKAAELLSGYVRRRFTPDPDGRRQRVMALVFRGENACEKIYSIVGNLPPDLSDTSKVTGETIRDTYCDLIYYRGQLRHFEPAVLTPPTQEYAMKKLQLISDFAESQDNLTHKIVGEEEDAEKTLAIIKPDNWRHASSKPGNIIDMFSRTGLRIIGCKVHRMSVSDALEFYGPVKDVLRKKLAPIIGKQCKSKLEDVYKLELDSADEEALTKIVGTKYADDQFNQIVEFMSGVRPDKCSREVEHDPGLVKCMILIYEGKNAIKKIRNVLGPTDPTKAPAGTIRADFGQNVMINTAHASDSTESVEREMRIVNIKYNNLSSVMKEFIAKSK